MLTKLIPFGGTDDVLVKDVSGARVRTWEDDAVGSVAGERGGRCRGERSLLEELVVAGCDVPALLVPPGQMLQLDREDGCLKAVQTGVPAEFVVKVALAHSVGAEHAAALVDDAGRGGDETGVAHGVEILGGIEAETGDVAQGPRRSAAPGCAEGLGGVFDQEKAICLFEAPEAVHIRTLPVEVDGHDGFGLPRVVCGMRDDRLDCCGTQVVGVGVNIRENWRGTAAQDGAHRGKEAEGRGDDDISGADSGTRHGEPECVGTAGATDGVRRSARKCSSALKRGDLRTKDKLLRVANLCNGCQNLLTQSGELPSEIKHHNRLNRRRCHPHHGKRRVFATIEIYD